MSRETEIAEIVAGINACWLEERYDEMRRYLHDEMVLALPGFEERVEGAGAVVDSYRDFGRRATIHAFEPDPPRVHVVGSTAVSTAAYTIDYEFEGTRYREGGADVLAFARDGDEWRVVWRTVVPETPEAG